MNERKVHPHQQDLSSNAYHVPVMLQEMIAALEVKSSGIYVDCTFGGGGHSKELLKHLGTEGKLFAFDQDADAKKNLPEDKRIVFLPHNFRHIQRFLRLHKIMQVDGIMADLGVSSHQFDEAERGFSTRFDGGLDMRMDQRQDLTAKQILNSYSGKQLHKLFEEYGEVTNAKTLAKAITEARSAGELKTIAQFIGVLQQIAKGNPHRYFAQVFQALRIEVNDELGALREFLQQVPALLKPGGRIAVLTFHSLEDRIVKQFFRTGSFSAGAEQDLFGKSPDSPLYPVTKKPVVPGEEESVRNPRARSAKLRVAEKK